MGRIREAWDALTKRDLASDELGWRSRNERFGGTVDVNGASAMRHSAVWACLRLRADLESAMPVDVYRKVAGVQLEVNKPAWLEQPSPGVDITEWLWSTRVDLDRYGNAFGVITKIDAAGRPAEIELLPAGDVSVRTNGRRIVSYRAGGEVFDPAVIWHERQYTIAGSPLGLSPIAAAAMSIGGYLSAQQFALDWYTSGASPSGTLRHTQKQVEQGVAQEMKARFRTAVAGRDIFVHGNDWEWKASQGDANSAAFLEEMRYGVSDVCRFLGVPGDMIDASTGGSSITYANVTQRNLQLLVVNLGPAITRRERKLSSALAQPRFVKLNSDALLRMDPQTRSAVLGQQIKDRILAPSEARSLLDRQPYTDEQLSEFDRLFGAPRQQQETLPAARAALPATGWAPYIEATVTDLPLAITGGWVPPNQEGGSS